MTRDEFIKEIETFFAGVVETIRKKNADYSNGDDPFRNFYVAEHLGITDARNAILVRKADKLARAATLLKKSPDVVSESLADTLADDAAYSAILAVFTRYLEKHDV